MKLNKYIFIKDLVEDGIVNHVFVDKIDIYMYY